MDFFCFIFVNYYWVFEMYITIRQRHWIVYEQSQIVNKVNKVQLVEYSALIDNFNKSKLFSFGINQLVGQSDKILF